MMLSYPTTTISQVHDAIVETMRGYFFDSVPNCGAYEILSPDGEEEPNPILQTPALILELVSIEPDNNEDQMPGRLAQTCVFGIHAVLSFETRNLQIELPEFASAVIAMIRSPVGPVRPPLVGQRWGLGEAVETPISVLANPSSFHPGLNGRDSWFITWKQVIYVPEFRPNTGQYERINAEPAQVTRTFLRLASGENIVAHRVVAVDLRGFAVLADNQNDDFFWRVVGISEASFTSVETARVQVSGEMTDQSWNFNVSLPVYLGRNGELMQTQPTSGFVKVLGFPRDSSTLLINLQPAINV